MVTSVSFSLACILSKRKPAEGILARSQDQDGLPAFHVAQPVDDIGHGVEKIRFDKRRRDPHRGQRLLDFSRIMREIHFDVRPNGKALQRDPIVGPHLPQELIGPA